MTLNPNPNPNPNPEPDQERAAWEAAAARHAETLADATSYRAGALPNPSGHVPYP